MDARELVNVLPARPPPATYSAISGAKSSGSRSSRSAAIAPAAVEAATAASAPPSTTVSSAARSSARARAFDAASSWAPAPRGRGRGACRVLVGGPLQHRLERLLVLGAARSRARSRAACIGPRSSGQCAAEAAPASSAGSPAPGSSPSARASAQVSGPSTPRGRLSPVRPRTRASASSGLIGPGCRAPRGRRSRRAPGRPARGTPAARGPRRPRPGCPVVMTSPGSRVNEAEIQAMSSATPNTMSAVRPSWRSSSLTHVRMPSACGSGTSSAVVIHGPEGAIVSPPFARIHCGSSRWRSRALTSSITA